MAKKFSELQAKMSPESRAQSDALAARAIEQRSAAERGEAAFPEEVRYGYMCGVEYGSELGHKGSGNLIFSTLEDLKRHKDCCRDDTAESPRDRCGILKVKVTVEEIIRTGHM